LKNRSEIILETVQKNILNSKEIFPKNSLDKKRVLSINPKSKITNNLNAVQNLKKVRKIGNDSFEPYNKLMIKEQQN
jgi:hypothetical protein